jgi:hypothetical protein
LMLGLNGQNIHRDLLSKHTHTRTHKCTNAKQMLPRQMFGKLQSKLFPIYFGWSAITLALVRGLVRVDD